MIDANETDGGAVPCRTGREDNERDSAIESGKTSAGRKFF